MHYASLHEAVVSGTGVERAFLCHAHPDRSASASVNVLKGLWTCYACGAGGTTKGLTTLTPADVRKRLELRERQEMRRQMHRSYPESWLKTFTAGGPGEYWRSRFEQFTCETFDLGVDPSTGSAVYPLRSPSGGVLGVVKRNLDEEGPKYRYPYGVDVRSTLFGYHQASSDRLVLVEGATDAMAAWEAGADALGVFGSSLRHTQLELLRKYSPRQVALAFDMDRAGQRLAREVSQAIRSDMPGVKVERLLWRRAKDLSELPLEERVEVLDSWQR